MCHHQHPPTNPNSIRANTFKHGRTHFPHPIYEAPYNRKHPHRSPLEKLSLTLLTGTFNSFKIYALICKRLSLAGTFWEPGTSVVSMCLPQFHGGVCSCVFSVRVVAFLQAPPPFYIYSHSYLIPT